jgi:RHS repeat-associated protein
VAGPHQPYDSAGNYLSYLDVDSGGGGSLTTTWQQKGGRFTTTATTGKVSIRLYNYMNSGWVAFDDVSLRPVVTFNLAYGAENRLTGVSGAATATFVYDGDGNRVKTTVGGVTTTYIGDYFEWTGSTATMIKYYYAGTARVAMRTGSGTGTTGLNWLVSDHLGSTSITADAGGNKVAELRYKAWGESRFSSGTTPTKRQYTGQLNETGIGLYFFNARWYDSALGRFIQADTIIPQNQGVQAWDRGALKCCRIRQPGEEGKGYRRPPHLRARPPELWRLRWRQRASNGRQKS